MSLLPAPVRTLNEMRQRFGFSSAVAYAAYRLANTLLRFDVLHIIALDRENLRPLKAGTAHVEFASDYPGGSRSAAT